ncbi:hypothetical protein F0P96_01405 [Hymenobacter busanensis]|uniref:Uncharacterized protein n=1 Tax=Hymenobacter busanensis TaxID=2607656 RepID=A0A7L4ZUR9_9BACT|nr:hypothetical protein [Hymenobacter busanensis]KAA9339310.1 hypothetical protein F0P96_01405 [Hymenobacter busanensis]QHJ06928.1 hypothetical protein GUY19_06345 [Hymenobacter busanensis]
MKHLLSAGVAAHGMLLILSLIVLFHLLIITGVIPFAVVWGGRLHSHSQMLRFETVSIGLNLLMLAVVARAVGRLRLRVNARFMQVALWLMALLFLANTAGNLLAKTELERLVFTPLTLLLALFSCRLAMEQKKTAVPASA